MASFFPQTKISDPTKAFGREADLAKLVEYAESLTQIQIIGARRFGKTTLSLCLETQLRNSATTNVYPLYIDVKTAGIKGTADFYRCLIAVLVSRLSSDRAFRTRQRFGTITIKPTCEYLKAFTELRSQPDVYMANTFIELCSVFAEKLRKTILVIFDEYEYMAKSAFDNLDGFMPLRNFSTEYLRSGLQPFFFWLVGARPWGCFVKENKLSNVDVIGGSGEFNGIEIEHYLAPISKDSFLKFWESRCNEYYDEQLNEEKSQEKNLIMSHGTKVFDSVSGVPFFGSSVAKHLKATRVFPDYTVIKSHIDETLQIFDKPTLSLLRSLCTPQSVSQNDEFNLLNNYGFLSISEDGICSLSMDFFKDYLLAKFPSIEQNITEPTSSNKRETLEKMVDSIDELIEDINETCSNKKHPLIFEPTRQERKLRLAIMEPCTTEDDFGLFVVSLAKIYYERSKATNPNTKKTVPGYRLAELETGGVELYKSRQFFSALEPCRTYYSAHLKDKVERHNIHQLDIGDALLILQGHRNAPDSPESWFALQVKMLQLFIAELKIIKQKVYSLP